MPEIDPEITLTVVIPAFMEEKDLPSTISSITAYFHRQPYAVEYVAVDDGSTDSTSVVAQAAGAKVIRLDRNRGKGAAVRAGMLAARGEFILFTDADYPYEIDSIELCMEKLRGGADVAIGSRNVPGSDRGRERAKRKVISKVGNVISRLLILPGISDTQAGFKCFRRDAARAIFSRTLIDGWGFDIEALYLARMLGLKIVEVPIRLILRPIKPSQVHSPIRAAINVLGSIFQVHWNRITGKYRRNSGA